MRTIKRPLKAPTQPVLDFTTLQHKLPLYASDKEDGIRCLIIPGLGPVSQKMLPIPNNWIDTILRTHCPMFLDGELVAIDCEGNDCDFNDTQSAVMSEDGQPRFEFRVFDSFEQPFMVYEQRMEQAEIAVNNSTDSCIKYLSQKLCRTVQDIETAEADALVRGKEGIMLRHPLGRYKEGRSTFNEAYLLKVKRFTDDEAIVIGIEEEMENCNPATTDAHGLAKRSKHIAQMRGKKLVGVLICKWRGRKIRIASGMNSIEKFSWWFTPTKIVGKIITFKYQAHGMKDLPRCPIFKGIRYD